MFQVAVNKAAGEGLKTCFLLQADEGYFIVKCHINIKPTVTVATKSFSLTFLDAKCCRLYFTGQTSPSQSFLLYL